MRCVFAGKSRRVLTAPVSMRESASSGFRRCIFIARISTASIVSSHPPTTVLGATDDEGFELPVLVLLLLLFEMLFPSSDEGVDVRLLAEA